jgi:hypothetical protein
MIFRNMKKEFPLNLFQATIKLLNKEYQQERYVAKGYIAQRTGRGLSTRRKTGGSIPGSTGSGGDEQEVRDGLEV